jgi:hypothetical protein
MTTHLMVLLAVSFVAPTPAEEPSDLATPVKILAAEKPIDVEIGHAAPFVADFDGDGVKDLLVGQFGGGKLRIYKNTGTNAKPMFQQFTWFQDGSENGCVPAG